MEEVHRHAYKLVEFESRLIRTEILKISGENVDEFNRSEIRPSARQIKLQRHPEAHEAMHIKAMSKDLERPQALEIVREILLNIFRT